MSRPRVFGFVREILVCVQAVIICELLVAHYGHGHTGSTISEPGRVSEREASDAPAPKAAAESFRWAMLESTDYRTYVRNLRAIGCPEQTIRDIITADVDANLYADKREKLRAREQELAGNPGLQALRREEQELWSEELQLIKRVLEEEASEPVGMNSGVMVSSATSAPPVMPLAFSVSVSNLTGFNDYQRGTVECFQRRFQADLDGLDPNSQEYAQRWREAQRQEDAVLKSVLGNQAYQVLLIEASRQQLISASRPSLE